jgi:hypothetical protein
VVHCHVMFGHKPCLALVVWIVAKQLILQAEQMYLTYNSPRCTQHTTHYMQHTGKILHCTTIFDHSLLTNIQDAVWGCDRGGQSKAGPGQERDGPTDRVGDRAGHLAVGCS